MSVMNEEAKSRSTRRSFTLEFKRDVVAMVIDQHRTIADVARSLGIGESNLGNWVKQARIDRGDRAGMTSEERSELVRLRRENARLRMERELLKRATAFWVKESGQ
ncbi:MAG: transposase [Acidimicrobiia bacterium]|nr:transposase [Acidimicrobiia bacterium]MBP8181576.1 transposase [Acidimicrobiia bacterium]